MNSNSQQRLQVSVVVPVYCAADYITECVLSVVDAPEVFELLLVEDGSPDDSLAVCARLAERFPHVRLLQHPHGVNLGAGASRNLGIQAACSPWVAFLDADDVAVPDRFAVTSAVIRANSDCEGVYEAVGTLGSHQPGDRLSEAELHSAKVTMLRSMIRPAELFDSMDPIASGGGMSTIGMTVRRDVLLDLGGFDTDLRVSQDILMWLRLAARGRLYSGDLHRIVSLRRVHALNRGRVSTNHRRYRSLMFAKLASGTQGYTLTPIRRAKVLSLGLLHAIVTFRHRRQFPITWFWRKLSVRQSVRHSWTILLHLSSIIRFLRTRKVALP